MLCLRLSRATFKPATIEQRLAPLSTHKIKQSELTKLQQQKLSQSSHNTLVWRLA